MFSIADNPYGASLNVHAVDPGTRRLTARVCYLIRLASFVPYFNTILPCRYRR